MNLKRQIRKLLAFEALWSFRLGGTVWVLLLVNRGFSLAEIGLAEGFFHLVSLCGEIPSGLCADLLGRKRTLAASQGVFMLSAAAMLLSRGMAGVLLSMGLQALGYNLASGTREALTYDSLVQCGAEGSYLKVSSRQNIVYRLGEALSVLCAGLAVLLGYRLSYGVDVLLALAGVLTALTLSEPVVTGGQRERESALIGGLGRRTADYLRETGRFLRSHPRAVGVMLFNALVGALATLLCFYLQDGLVGAGATAALLGPMLLFVGLGGAVGSWMSRFLGKLRYAAAGVLCVLGVAAGYALTASGAAAAMAAGGFLAAACDDGIQVLTDARLNESLPSDQRATLISVSSMCFSLVMAVLSPLAGALAG